MHTAVSSFFRYLYYKFNTFSLSVFISFTLIQKATSISDAIGAPKVSNVQGSVFEELVVRTDCLIWYLNKSTLMRLIIHFSVGTLTNLEVAELVNVLAEFSSLSFSYVACLYYCTSANIQQY